MDKSKEFNSKKSLASEVDNNFAPLKLNQSFFE